MEQADFYRVRRKRQDGDFAVEPGFALDGMEAALVEVLDRFGLDEHNSHHITGIWLHNLEV